MAFMVNGQDFKVIKETNDYMLKEVDSVYYFTHGIEPKNDFVIDTNVNYWKKGELTLKFDNGKGLIYTADGHYSEEGLKIKITYMGCNKILNDYLVFQGYYNQYEGRCEIKTYYLINKSNGEIDELYAQPLFNPSYNYYLFASRNITFKNLKTNVKNNIIFVKDSVSIEDEVTFYFKWVNDISFEFQSQHWDDELGAVSPTKYYLVQIKK
jgi:hypothetical protein